MTFVVESTDRDPGSPSFLFYFNQNIYNFLPFFFLFILLYIKHFPERVRFTGHNVALRRFNDVVFAFILRDQLYISFFRNESFFFR